MRPHHALAVGLLTSLSLTVLQHEVAFAAPTSSADTSVVGVGAVVDHGKPVAGATVAVVAQPSTAALQRAGSKGLAALPLGLATTDAQGAYRIVANLETLPQQYIGTMGETNVSIVASGPEGDNEWSLDLFPDGTDIPGVRVAPSSDESISSTGTLAGGKLAPWVRFDLGSGVTTDSAAQTAPISGAALKKALTDGRARSIGEIQARRNAKIFTYVRTYLRAGQHLTPNAAEVPDTCAYQWSTWKYGVTEYFVRVYSASGIPVTVTEGSENSTTHTLGVAAISSSGKLTASGTSSLTASVKVSQPNVADATVYNSVNYRRKVFNCGDDKWYPYSFKDYLTDFKYSGDTNFGTCSAKSSGSTWSTGTAKNSTFTSGIDLGAISLSSQSGYSNSLDLTYHFTRAGKICGSSSQGAASSPQVSAQ